MFNNNQAQFTEEVFMSTLIDRPEALCFWVICFSVHVNMHAFQNGGILTRSYCRLLVLCSVSVLSGGC